MTENITLLVNEEYGYREWIWETQRNEEELAQLWEKHSENPAALINAVGRWEYLDDGRIPSGTEVHGTAHIHDEDDSLYQLLDMKTAEEMSHERNIWDLLGEFQEIFDLETSIKVEEMFRESVEAGKKTKRIVLDNDVCRVSLLYTYQEGNFSPAEIFLNFHRKSQQ